MSLQQTLNARRKALDMSIPAIARRAGVSVLTVRRVLTKEGASFAKVVAVAEALGVSLEPKVSDAHQFKRRQAEAKAEKIVGMVQSTSGLESQAVSGEARKQLVEQAVHELMTGSPRKLWAE